MVSNAAAVPASNASVPAVPASNAAVPACSVSNAPLPTSSAGSSKISGASSSKFCCSSKTFGLSALAVGLGVGIYELGNSFHWWGDGHSETTKPTAPEKPDVTPPTAPDLKDIPTPKNIIVKNVAPSKSISAHYNLVSAPTMNLSLIHI